MIEASGEAGFQGATSTNHSANDNSILCQSQELPPFTKSQKRLLDMSTDDLVIECKDARDAGWTGRYIKQKVWDAFWHCCELPEVHSLLVRLDEAVLAVFGAETVLDFDTRREYWQAKKHPSPELAAASEVNGNKLANDIHKEAAQARGELPATPDARMVIQRCKQLSYQFATRGKGTTEPLWFAVLKVLAACTPDLSKECSDGHAGFTQQELDNRIARIKSEGLKPTTCNYFNNLNPSGCVGCPFPEINSPMSLAYENLPRSKSSHKQVVA